LFSKLSRFDTWHNIRAVETEILKANPPPTHFFRQQTKGMGGDPFAFPTIVGGGGGRWFLFPTEFGLQHPFIFLKKKKRRYFPCTSLGPLAFVFLSLSQEEDSVLGRRQGVFVFVRSLFTALPDSASNILETEAGQ